jgi:hypothetical protein
VFMLIILPIRIMKIFRVPRHDGPPPLFLHDLFLLLRQPVVVR